MTRVGGNIDDYINDFCDRIFAIPWLRRSLKLFTGERNTGQEAGRLASQFIERPNTYCIRQKVGQDWGWTTGPGGTPKAKYIAALLDAFQRDAIVYAETMVCTHLPGVDEKSQSTRMRELTVEFEAQLARMNVFIDEPKDAFGGKSKTNYGGKYNGEGKRVHGLNDDMVLSFAMNILIIHHMITGSIETMDPAIMRTILH